MQRTTCELWEKPAADGGHHGAKAKSYGDLHTYRKKIDYIMNLCKKYFIKNFDYNISRFFNNPKSNWNFKIIYCVSYLQVLIIRGS